MKKSILALAILGATSVAQAGTVTMGVSNATQDLSADSFSYSADNTGLMVDWHSDSLFGMKHLQQGLGWNGATKEGNVLSYYIRPHMEITSGLELFGKLGASTSGASSNVSGLDSGLKVSPTYGVGLSYNLPSKFAVVAQYDQLYVDDYWDMSAISLGVSYQY